MNRKRFASAPTSCGEDSIGLREAIILFILAYADNRRFLGAELSVQLSSEELTLDYGIRSASFMQKAPAVLTPFSVA